MHVVLSSFHVLKIDMIQLFDFLKRFTSVSYVIFVHIEPF